MGVDLSVARSTGVLPLTSVTSGHRGLEIHIPDGSTVINSEILRLTTLPNTV